MLLLSSQSRFKPMTESVAQQGARCKQQQGTWEVWGSQGADEPLQGRVAGPGAAEELVQAAGQGAQVAARARVAQRAHQAAHQTLALRRNDLPHRLPVNLRAPRLKALLPAANAAHSSQLTVVLVCKAPQSPAAISHMQQDLPVA